MTKKASKIILHLVVLIIVGVACFYLGRFSMLKDQSELKGLISAPAALNPVENLPETNPFKEADVNPFDEGYTNPFSE